MNTKTVGTDLRLGGGGGDKCLRIIFLVSHFHIKRIQFCTLVYL